MSRESLTQVVERASTDPAFRAELHMDPQSALAGYDLSAEERAALVSGDTSRVEALGVDARVTKIDNWVSEDGGPPQSIIGPNM